MEAGWDQFPRGGEPPTCFSGGVYDTFPASAHATMNTAAFGVTQEYRAHGIVFFCPPPPPSFRNEPTPSRFTVGGTVALIPAANSFRCEKEPPLQGPADSATLYNIPCACQTLAGTNNMDENSVTSIQLCGSASESIPCLSALVPTSSSLQPCQPISWAQAIGFPRQLALRAGPNVGKIYKKKEIKTKNRTKEHVSFISRIKKIELETPIPPFSYFVFLSPRRLEKKHEMGAK